MDSSEGTANILEVKVGGRKKIADLAGFRTDAPTPGVEQVDFFDLQF